MKTHAPAFEGVNITPSIRGGDVMYVTWECLLMFCSIIVSIITLAYTISENNKKR